MANVFATVNWLMQESLDVLDNVRSVSKHFNTEVQREFEHDFAPGDTVRVKFPQEYLIRSGMPYDTNNPINRRTTTVTCDQIFGIDYQWDSYEQAVKLERGEEVLSREYIKPAMIQLAQEIEDRCTKFAYQNTANIVGVLGTDPTDFDSTSAAARERLVQLAAPIGIKDSCMVVSPTLMRSLKKSSISYFNPVPDLTKQWRTGIVGSGDNFDWYESPGLYSHTAGTWAGTVSYSSGVSDGVTSMVVNTTNGDTFKQGDVFSMASVNMVNPRTRRTPGVTRARQFCITQDTTSTGATATIYFTPPIFGPNSQYQNVDALPAASAALTLFPGTTSPNGKVGTQHLAIAPDAFALVNVKFANPKEGGNIAIAKQLTDDDSGLTLSLLRYFDGDSRTWKTRFDVCMGFGNLYNGNNSVRILGA